MTRIGISFTYAGKHYSYTFNHRINILIGDSAIGKSFMRHSTEFEVYVKGSETRDVHYLSNVTTEQQHLIDIKRYSNVDLIIIDDAYAYSLIENNLLHDFMNVPANIIFISRMMGLLPTIQLSPRQFYTLYADGRHNTHTVAAFPDCVADTSRPGVYLEHIRRELAAACELNQHTNKFN